MILIADSGSTKTDWCVVDGENSISEFTTQGINPVHQSAEEMERILRKELLLMLSRQGENGIVSCDKEITAVYFYGAGCLPHVVPVVSTVLLSLFPVASVEVASDMLGAARALCGRKHGIVCILGTGSNSCYYNGEQIVDNVPPLGYILGDEGSGATLGKRLVGDCLKRQLPEYLCEAFLKRFQLTSTEIIERVYRRPLPNRFLAGLSCFLYENRSDEHIHRLIVSCFSEFLSRNVLSYPSVELYFVGSIAYYYAEELKEAAAMHHLMVAAVTQRPMEGLIAYHTNKL